jgi:hypothetical protein
MALYPLAHLLAAMAVVLSARATLRQVALAALLYVGAFSIYQSVAANAATIFVIWLLCRVMFGGPDEAFSPRAAGTATIAVFLAAVAGGVLYLAAVSAMHIEFDSTQGTDEAFRLGGMAKLSLAVHEVWNGTRSFFIWPERYFPDYLKGLQFGLLAAAGIFCLAVPKQPWVKMASVSLLLLACFTPRLLQLLHPAARYHSLTLTAYAVLVAGAVTILIRAGRTLFRNVSIIVASLLIAGYVLQCNWISTVNDLNTRAHFATVTQMLARLRAIPGSSWDGKRVAVVGSYDMPSDYPFKPHDAVASRFIDAKHMSDLARLMRDEATFVAADETMPQVLDFARARSPWPHPDSVGVVDGMGVLVLAQPKVPSR